MSLAVAALVVKIWGQPRPSDQPPPQTHMLAGEPLLPSLTAVLDILFVFRWVWGVMGACAWGRVCGCDGRGMGKGLRVGVGLGVCRDGPGGYWERSQGWV